MFGRVPAIAAMLLMSVAAAAGAEALPYLYDQIKLPAYRQPLQHLLAGHRLPSWIGGFMADSNGVATPGDATVVDGKPYELYAVCETHNCAGNFLYVLYTPHGGHAWALVTKDDKTIATLGNPSPAQRQALTAAAAKGNAQ